MSGNTIQIPVPPEMPPAGMELLKAMLQAVVMMRCECSESWTRVLKDLEADDWKVEWRLTWIAEARRGNDYEQVSGRTLDETFERLRQLTRLDALDGTP